MMLRITLAQLGKGKLYVGRAAGKYNPSKVNNRHLIFIK
jgi:hypothetical protein